MGRKWKCG